MKWLEIIELRSVDRNWGLLKTQLPKMINEVNLEVEKQTIRIYSRMLLDTDFSIHLFNDTEKAEYMGSKLGLRIASALKEFGLVNHKILIELSNTDDLCNSSLEE